jgi:hypothetical protein
VTIVKFPALKPRTASELFTELAEDDAIAEVVVVYKKTYNKGTEEEFEGFVCESTQINMADLCLAEKTLSINVTKIMASESSDFQGFFTT